MTSFEKMKMETMDRTETNIEKIGALFPNCVTEAKDENGVLKKTINFDLLRQMLSGDIVEGREAYEFSWVGKKAAIIEANKSIRKTLRPCVEESVDWDHTENLYIEGDNLDVLKLIQESYLGKVKMIYIDPPYNTGNDFIYKDDFTISEEDYAEMSEAIDDEGLRLFKNTESNGRFHSDWCSMIYSRLMFARNLLTEDGVIFISIDDNEQDNLKKICDEIFGSSNFIAQIIWEKVHTRKNSAINFSISHEYIICYANIKRGNSKISVGFQRNLLPRENLDDYNNPDNDPKGPWKVDPITAHNYYSADYSITKPNGCVIQKPQDRYWAYSEETFKEMIKNNAIIWGEGNNMPSAKRYLCDTQNGIVPVTLFSRKFAGDTSLAKKNIDELFPSCKGIFDYTKPVKLLMRLLQIASNKDDIVLDFFSGSATTAHAVMQLNAEDGGKRKFIMVQLPEPCGEKTEAFKAGYKNICEIGKERIRRAGQKIREDMLKENPLFEQENSPDFGFRVFKVDESNMKDVYFKPDEYNQSKMAEMVSNIKENRSDLDLLFGCLLDWGIPLSGPHTFEKIGSFTVHTYNGGDLIACFDRGISEEVIKIIAKRKPIRAVFWDSSFKDSAAKINASEIFKTQAPQTKVKVI